MKEKAKRSPAEGDFLFEIDPQPLEECVTALGGVPLLVRAIRSLDVPGSVQRELPSGRVSYIPRESAPLRGLAQVNEDVMQELGRRCPEQKIATLDLDATLIESWKREAKTTYAGTTGYQPLLALWAELNVVVADEFRDGNVPAQQAPLPVTQRGFRHCRRRLRNATFAGIR